MPRANTSKSAGTEQPQAFAARLLRWYDHHHRDLPWRRSRDPWAIWVSEIMLQQTRVEAVTERYAAFMARYPTPASFAAVDDDELLDAWRGLGYYRRARLLRQGAHQVVDSWAGEVPADSALLGQISGIGVYTRGAIASIAFGEVCAAIDGNVERVLARHRWIDSDIKKAEAHQRLRRLVDELIDRNRPGDFNQALMELGATLCGPRRPACERCPLTTDCVAHLADRQTELPRLPTRRPSTAIHARAVLAPQRGDRVLAARIPIGEVNEGQLELPGPGLLIDHKGGDSLAATLRQRFGADFEIGKPLATIRHTITHHRIRWTVHQGIARSIGKLIPASLSDPAVPWSTPTRKYRDRHGLSA